MPTKRRNLRRGRKQNKQTKRKKCGGMTPEQRAQYKKYQESTEGGVHHPAKPSKNPAQKRESRKER